MDQGLVLVDLRARSMTQSRIPRVCVRRTATRAPVARNSLIPRKSRPADTNAHAGMTLGESTGLALKKAVAPGPDWLLCRAFANLSSPFPCLGRPCPAGVSSRGAVPEM